MQIRLKGLLLTALFFATIALDHTVKAQDAHPSDLTANDLAEVLSIHWWTVGLPIDLGPKDMVGTEWVTSDGKTFGGGGGFFGGKLGSKLRVFCWEDEFAHQAKVRLETSGGSETIPFKNYFKDSAVGGPSNGTVLKVGDFLIIFDNSKHPSFGGNTLMNGQLGLRVVVTRKH